MLSTGPQPGDIYKEWTYQHIGHADAFHMPHFAEVDPEAQSSIALKLLEEHKPETPRYLVIDDLKDAVRAELAIEYWGGHIGTSFRGFRVNQHDWLPIPRPFNTPVEPERFFHTLLGSLATPIPLEQLHQGVNAFQFGAGPQIDYGFDCGFFWVYSFTVRVYYAPSKPHHEGKIIAPESGADIGDDVWIEAEITPDICAQVDFLANYKDYDWEGDGLFQQWHAQRNYGVLRRHLGHRSVPPYRVKWDTTWVPDQVEPIQIAAQITADDGTKHMTMPSEGILLKRLSRLVVMYQAQDIPENFGVRVRQIKSCQILIDGELTKAKQAQLVLSTWSGAHAEEICLNGIQLVKRVGKVHDYSFNAIKVPLEILQSGENIFSIFSSTEEHAAEINWPGPALFVEYR